MGKMFRELGDVKGSYFGFLFLKMRVILGCLYVDENDVVGKEYLWRERESG